MLEVDTSIRSIPARPEQVLWVYESEEPVPLEFLGGMQGFVADATIVCTRDDFGAPARVFLHLFQADSSAAVVYASSSPLYRPEQMQAEAEQALLFAESLGFRLRNLWFASLGADEQTSIVERLPVFRAATATLDLVEVADDSDSKAMDAHPLALDPEWALDDSAESARQPVSFIARLLATFCVLLVWLPMACVRRDGNVEKVVQSQVDLGNFQLGQARWMDALREFHGALDKDPKNRDALRGTALAYMNLQNLEDAERYYRDALNASRDWSVAKNELAVVLIQRGQCMEAEELLRSVLKDLYYETPHFAEHNLAKSLACQGRVPEALETLEGLLLRRTNFCLGYLTYAQMAAEANRPEKTIDACLGFQNHCENDEEISQQILPQQSALCYLEQGKAYGELGDVDSARASFRRCRSKGDLRDECRRALQMLPP